MMWMSLFNLAWAMAPPQQKGAEGGGSAFAAFIPLIIILVIFYFLLIRPQQKQAKKHRELLQNLKKGDWVMTAGGLRGKIVNVSDTVVTLELPPDNAKVKITKNYIAGLLKSETEK
ncbi:MAG: preprotein translocase subunit YajC [Candidatus Desulfofervidaceae bacterium]|nr:preprotein translocase subunit YajC [Candidatus Desulfofervidaceae bacterium]